MTDDQALERYAAHQDPDAFRCLVLRYQGLVYAAAWRCLGNRDDAEEAAQETFLRLAKQAGQVRGALGGWLHRCATHVAIDRIRRDASRRRREHARATPESEYDGRLDADAEAHELTRAVDRAVADLGETDRAVLVGLYLEGRTQTELAASVGLSQSGLSRRRDRALARVRTTLKKRGIVAAAGAVAAALQTPPTAAQVPGPLTEHLLHIGLSGVGSETLKQGGLLMATSWTTGKLTAALGTAALLLAAGTAVVVATNADDPPPPAPASLVSAPATTPAPDAASVPNHARLGDFDVTFETVAPQTLVYTEHPFTEAQVPRIGQEWFPALARAVHEGGYEVTGPPVLIFLEDPQDPDDLTLQLAMPVHPDDLLVDPEPGLLARQTEPFACARVELSGGPQDFGPAANAFYDTLEAAGYDLGHEFRMVVQRVFEVDGQFHNDIHLQVEILQQPG